MTTSNDLTSGQPSRQMSARGAVFPGSFDPVTNGHLELIARASSIFCPLVIGVALGGHGHTSKVPFLALKERVDLLNEVINSWAPELSARLTQGAIRVEYFNGLLVDFVRSQNLSIVVRGVRSLSDFESESQMASVNRDLDRSLETVFLFASRDTASISSSIVRQIAAAGGDLTPFVPPAVAQILRSANTAASKR